jgi:hypothetical protein
MLFFCIQYEIKSVAILHDTRRAPAAAGTPISYASQRVLVEADTHDLCSFATPVVPVFGGKVRREPPLALVVDGPYSIHAHPRSR